jgi:hypothetical protein
VTREVSWTPARAEYIATRSERYPHATNIRQQWVKEATSDPQAAVSDPDPHSLIGAVRIVGYSPTAGFVITVIALPGEDELWGVSAWTTTGAERRDYWESR